MKSISFRYGSGMRRIRRGDAEEEDEEDDYSEQIQEQMDNDGTVAGV